MESNQLDPPPFWSETAVFRMSLFGVGLASIAAAIGLFFPADDSAAAWVNDYLVPMRAILSALGTILAGCAVSLRFRQTKFWLLTAATCGLAGLGFPQAWDSFSMVAYVFGSVSLVGALMTVVPFQWRIGIAGAFALYHFTGIFLAVTSPQPAPFLTTQLWALAFRPYLYFAYLNNAYQFYSPQPGPASEVWFCIKYEPLVTDRVLMEVLQQTPDGEPVRDKNKDLVYGPMLDANGEPTGEPIYDAGKNLIFKNEKDRHGNPLKKPLYFDSRRQKPQYVQEMRWIKIPRRENDYKDPLGQTFYRRLSLTEYVSHGTAITEFPPKIQAELKSRRLNVTSIPLNEALINISGQYRYPNWDVQNYLLPSYVRHTALANQRPDRKISSIMVYAVTHTIVEPEQFVGAIYDGKRRGVSLMDPTTYWPYYMGEFNTDGELLRKNDELLYWLIPIFRNPAAPPSEFENLPRRLKLTDYKRLYFDCIAIHAGSHHMAGELDK
ncbi:MAG: hypothetical protein K8T89_25990 [Planctomycetes bacterium]|nr:hypothetical protein [Planctomycetota bacterium]